MLKTTTTTTTNTTTTTTRLKLDTNPKQKSNYKSPKVLFNETHRVEI